MSPYNHPFHSDNPILVQAGTAELLFEEIKGFSEKMSGVSGNQIHLYDTPQAPHDIIVVGGYTGSVSQAEEIDEAVRKFLNIELPSS